MTQSPDPTVRISAVARPGAEPPEPCVPGPRDDVLGRLAELARTVPERTALDSAAGSLTFAELHERVRALSAELTALLAAGPPGRSIAVYAEQDTDSAAAVVAAATTGAPCVVLDVTMPPARVAQVAEAADVAVVLADGPRRADAATLRAGAVVRGLLPEGGAPQCAERAVALSSPALLLFTSGTTGGPKGVLFTQGTVLASAYNHGRAWRLTADDRVGVVMPTSFGAAMNVLFGALLNGAAACLRDPRLHGLTDLAGWLESARITVLCCTPSLLRALGGALPAGHVLPDLRLVATGGEKVFGRDVADFRPHLGPDASVMNWLGSSEGSGLSVFEVRAGDPVPEGVLPAGPPLPLQQFEVLDEEGRPVPAGEVGTLHVTSAYLAAGYWNDPAQTAERFIPLPDGRTRFRSGDRARLDADGVLHLVGRADDAVKIRGYLVEPAEVEAALRALPQVRDVVVQARPDETGQDRLVAWVVPDPAGGTASAAILRAGVARTLPAWMVPRDVVLLEDLPRTERGKVDGRGLPPVPERPRPTPPRTPVEEAVEAIWSALLHLERVGREESFTALGGDSLAVEEMLAAVQARLGAGLTTADLAEHTTLAEFAALVATAGGRPGRRGSDVVQLRTTGGRPPLFCFAGAGGAAAAFGALAGALGPDQPVHAFQVHGFESRGIPDWTVGRAARRYLRRLEQLAPEGPVLLAGHSLGGLFALAVAHLLRGRGREVRLLVVLDTHLPLPARGEGAERRVGPASEPISRAELWRTRLQVLTAGLVRRPPEVQKEVFHQHGARVGRFHRPQPWPGQTLLVLSAENDDEDAWWAPLLPGEHQVHRFDCGHNALLRHPYVDRIAELVTAAVDDARVP